MCRAVVAPGTQPALFGVGIVQRTIKAGLYITQPLLIAVADIVITHQFAVTATFSRFCETSSGKETCRHFAIVVSLCCVCKIRRRDWHSVSHAGCVLLMVWCLLTILFNRKISYPGFSLISTGGDPGKRNEHSLIFIFSIF